MKDKKISRRKFIKRLTGTLAATIISTKFTNSFLYSEDKTVNEKKSKRIIPEKRKLGKTNLMVTTICFGGSRTIDPSLVQYALEKGINFIDTGRGYFRGKSEEVIGKVTKKIRKNLIFQSKAKLRLNRLKKRYKNNLGYGIVKTLQQSLDESLTALQTDYIDVLLLHGVHASEEITNESVMDFFSDAKKKGKIRACGFSSHRNMVEVLSGANDLKFYDVVMVPFNHAGSFTHSRSDWYSEWDQAALIIELKKAEKNGMGIVAMKSCSAGPYSLNGKTNKSYADAIKWVIGNNFIHSVATAMGNTNEIDEDVKVMYV